MIKKIVLIVISVVLFVSTLLTSIYIPKYIEERKIIEAFHEFRNTSIKQNYVTGFDKIGEYEDIVIYHFFTRGGVGGNYFVYRIEDYPFVEEVEGTIGLYIEGKIYSVLAAYNSDIIDIEDVGNIHSIITKYKNKFSRIGYYNF